METKRPVVEVTKAREGWNVIVRHAHYSWTTINNFPTQERAEEFAKDVRSHEEGAR